MIKVTFINNTRTPMTLIIHNLVNLCWWLFSRNSTLNTYQFRHRRHHQYTALLHAASVAGTKHADYISRSSAVGRSGATSLVALEANSQHDKKVAETDERACARAGIVSTTVRQLGVAKYPHLPSASIYRSLAVVDSDLSAAVTSGMGIVQH